MREILQRSETIKANEADVSDIIKASLVGWHNIFCTHNGEAFEASHYNDGPVTEESYLEHKIRITWRTVAPDRITVTIELEVVANTREHASRRLKELTDEMQRQCLNY